MPTNKSAVTGETNILKRIDMFVSAWEECAPDAVFAGMTLEEFKAVTAPSRKLREYFRELQMLICANVSDKAHADRVSRDAANRVVGAVKADIAFGSNSPFYRAMGFIPTNERKRPRRKKLKPEPAYMI